ncbi:hypothetical protein [Nostoc sp. UHCC 0251]|uniref:hypothetical protein n=1 Tax=Nostoc sp. UHCC 0251 TaxID=3110240 RepID=UPI002B21D279|nr:hypothetical protein [Nostoc sp. UHCC 0251]MEA5624166.1 hypothetical protein [Nostoc sp. UHCC 0251]
MWPKIELIDLLKVKPDFSRYVEKSTKNLTPFPIRERGNSKSNQSFETHGGGFCISTPAPSSEVEMLNTSLCRRGF